MNLLQQYGFDNSYEILKNSNEVYARVISASKNQYTIVSEYGISSAVLKSSVYHYKSVELYPVTGDFVCVIYNKDGNSTITKTLERKSTFKKFDDWNSSLEQVLCSNFDYVFIVTSANKEFNEKRLVRYITQTLNGGAQPIILISKSDLVDDTSSYIERIKKYNSTVDIIPISSYTGKGLTELDKYLVKQKTVLFMGSSGVGKSTLMNSLIGNELIATGDIREQDSKGRHTTTNRQLILLDSGCMVIDSPGIRELGLTSDEDSIFEAFTEVKDFEQKCKFKNCTHTIEPGCAVQQAIMDEQLDGDTFEYYEKLRKEAKYYETRSSGNTKSNKSIYTKKSRVTTKPDKY